MSGNRSMRPLRRLLEKCTQGVKKNLCTKVILIKLWAIYTVEVSLTWGLCSVSEWVDSGYVSPTCHCTLLLACCWAVYDSN